MHEELGNRLRSVAARSQTINYRSVVLVEASRYLRDREALIPRCAWCGKVALGGGWMPFDEVPHFLHGEVRTRATHGICPSCFPAHAVASRVAVHAGSKRAAAALTESLREFGVLRTADGVLQVRAPAGDGEFVNRLLSRVADCLTAHSLGPVQVQVGAKTYALAAREF